jgi:type II secretory pathway predicted ATPase ExeA
MSGAVVERNGQESAGTESAEPVSTTRTGLLTYEPYYGLDDKPFSLSTCPRTIYQGESHAPVRRELIQAVQRREGLVVLTGEIGTGKTTLCRSVIAGLDRKTCTGALRAPRGPSSAIRCATS